MIFETCDGCGYRGQMSAHRPDGAYCFGCGLKLMDVERMADELSALREAVKEAHGQLEELTCDRDYSCARCGGVFGEHAENCRLSAALARLTKWLPPEEGTK